MIGSEKIANAAISATPIRILDPACGTGGFLVYALRHSLEILRKKLEGNVISHRVFDDGKRNLMRSVFFGSEASEGVACAAKMNMIVAGDGHTNIIPEDSLRVESTNWHMHDANCDVILTNPPFGTSRRTRSPQRIRPHTPFVPLGSTSVSAAYGAGNRPRRGYLHSN